MPGGQQGFLSPLPIANDESSGGLNVRDVDALVREIKENLQVSLSSNSSTTPRSPTTTKSGSSGGAPPPRQRSRPAPYIVPPSSRCSRVANSDGNEGIANNPSNNGGGGGKWRRQPPRKRYPSTCKSVATMSNDEGPDDPFRVLQELISAGKLVNEAVRRLQMGAFEHKKAVYDSDDDNNNVFNAAATTEVCGSI